MWLDDLWVVLIDIVFINFDEVESDVISICINCVCQKFRNKWSLRKLHILKRKPESPFQDKDFDNFLWNDKLLVFYKEIKYFLMRKDNFWVGLGHICSLILNHDWNKIKNLDSCVLVLIHLFVFDGDQLISNIFSDMKLAFGVDQMINHFSFLFSQNNK